MLNKPIDEIVVENGKVVGVKSEGEVSALVSEHFCYMCKLTFSGSSSISKNLLKLKQILWVRLWEIT